MKNGKLIAGLSITGIFLVALAPTILYFGNRMDKPAPAPMAKTDFYCTNYGAESFLVEDVRYASLVHPLNVWRVETEATEYYYTPRPGDVCTTVVGGL